MTPPKISELQAAIRLLRPYLTLAGILSTVIALLGLAPIGYMRDVYGPVIDSRSLNTLAMVTLVLLIAVVTSGLLSWVRARVMSAASVKFAETVSLRVLDACFVANLAGNPAARTALNDSRTIRNFTTSPSMVALMDAPLGLLFLVLVFLIHPVMGVISTLGAVLVFVIAWQSERKVRPLVKQGQRFYNQGIDVITDSGRKAQVVQAMGMHRAIFERWARLQDQFLRDQAQASKVQATGSALSRTVMMAQGSLVLGVGVLLTITGVLPAQAGAYLIIAKILGGKAVAPIVQLINSWKQVVAARDAFDRLEEFLERVPPRPEQMKLPRPRGFLTVENAAIRAPGSKALILSELNFNQKPGRAIAIIGPSGCGKSSLARVLLGIWAPVQGSVRIDGVDVTSWNKAELGPALGYLPQDVELFDGTIAENIARFGDVDREQVARAAHLAGLDPVLAQLPKGMDTDIGDDGCVLSGGQRQRVGLARALYGDPQLVVLDEPNSSLDAQGEQDLVTAIVALKKRGATVVIITHRPKLLGVAEHILVLGKGRPRMFGPREKVLEKLAQARAAALAPAASAGAPVAEADADEPSMGEKA
ncbi:MAG: type I secretion system permease/ATPase [Limnohabitans sp.]